MPEQPGTPGVAWSTREEQTGRCQLEMDFLLQGWEQILPIPTGIESQDSPATLKIRLYFAEELNKNKLVDSGRGRVSLIPPPLASMGILHSKVWSQKPSQNLTGLMEKEEGSQSWSWVS